MYTIFNKKTFCFWVLVTYLSPLNTHPWSSTFDRLSQKESNSLIVPIFLVGTVGCVILTDYVLGKYHFNSAYIDHMLQQNKLNLEDKQKKLADIKAQLSSDWQQKLIESFSKIDYARNNNTLKNIVKINELPERHYGPRIRYGGVPGLRNIFNLFSKQLTIAHDHPKKKNITTAEKTIKEFNDELEAQQDSWNTYNDHYDTAQNFWRNYGTKQNSLASFVSENKLQRSYSTPSVQSSDYSEYIINNNTYSGYPPINEEQFGNQQYKVNETLILEDHSSGNYPYAEAGRNLDTISSNLTSLVNKETIHESIKNKVQEGLRLFKLMNAAFKQTYPFLQNVTLAEHSAHSQARLNMEQEKIKAETQARLQEAQAKQTKAEAKAQKVQLAREKLAWEKTALKKREEIAQIEQKNIEMLNRWSPPTRKKMVDHLASQK